MNKTISCILRKNVEIEELLCLVKSSISSITVATITERWDEFLKNGNKFLVFFMEMFDSRN